MNLEEFQMQSVQSTQKRDGFELKVVSERKRNCEGFKTEGKFLEVEDDYY